MLYATEWCGYCAAARRMFATHGIRYTEQDIEKSREALDAFRCQGGRGVPLILIGRDVYHGYNEAAVKAVLGPWLKGG